VFLPGGRSRSQVFLKLKEANKIKAFRNLLYSKVSLDTRGQKPKFSKYDVNDENEKLLNNLIRPSTAHSLFHFVGKY
jgi:hypothetical protein